MYSVIIILTVANQSPNPIPKIVWQLSSVISYTHFVDMFIVINWDIRHLRQTDIRNMDYYDQRTPGKYTHVYTLHRLLDVVLHIYLPLDMFRTSFKEPFDNAVRHTSLLLLSITV